MVGFLGAQITSDYYPRLARYQQFKDFQRRILVATNLFGRGMDIERVNIAFNYDMPEDSDTYLHRVGSVHVTMAYVKQNQIMGCKWIHLNSFNFSHSFRLREPAGLERKVWPSPLCQMRLTHALWTMFRTGLRWTSANFQRRLTSRRTVSVNIPSLQAGFKGLIHKNIQFSYVLFTLIKKKKKKICEPQKKIQDITTKDFHIKKVNWEWGVEVQNENICMRETK